MAGSAILKIDVLADATKAVTGLNERRHRRHQADQVGARPSGRSRRPPSPGSPSSVAGMALGGLGAATAVAALGTALVDASKAAMEDEKSQALLREGDAEQPGGHRRAGRLDGGLDRQDRPGGGGRRRRAAARVAEPDHRRPGRRRPRRTPWASPWTSPPPRGSTWRRSPRRWRRRTTGTWGRCPGWASRSRTPTARPLDFEEALANAAETMGGSATAAALTLEGQMERTTIAVDEAKESVGGLRQHRAGAT